MNGWRLASSPGDQARDQLARIVSTGHGDPVGGDLRLGWHGAGVALTLGAGPSRVCARLPGRLRYRRGHSGY